MSASRGALLWIAKVHRNRGKSNVPRWFLTRIDRCDDTNEKEEV